jgi:threonine/homoserine/homoserine lactone efflux protein
MGRGMQLPVDPARYGAYLGITAVMVVTPGPANLFAIATGAARGRTGVLAAVLGMNLANAVWYLAAGLGLAALALTFPAAFRLLAWLGAAYVAWLGLKALSAARRQGAAPAEPRGAATAALRRSALLDGFVVQISNPKALVFITAILPLFVDPTRPILAQMVLFAAAGVLGDATAMTAYGFGGAAIARRMREPAFRRGFGVATGLLLLGAALLIALRG